MTPGNQTTQLVSVYDEVAFPSYPHAASHPERLATIARLSGITTATVDRCRVLELGCGAGGNLLPMADSLPESEFLGIDLCQQQIELGREYAAAAGLANVRFEVRDILSLNDSFGHFDFIIAHGVYSWTIDAVREKILDLCREALTPHGIVYINFNAYPGWHLQGMLRDMLRFHAQTASSPVRQVYEARRMIAFLQESLPSPTTAFGSLVRAELDAIQRNSDPFLFHAYLNVVNQPFYLHELQSRASKYGLHYIGDADPELNWPEDSSRSVASRVNELTTDKSRWPQLFDFVRFTTSRRSLFCRRDVSIEQLPRGATLHGLNISSPLRALSERTQDGSSTFVMPGGKRVSTREPLLGVALHLLSERWPESIPFGQFIEPTDERDVASKAGLKQSTEQLSRDLWQCFCQNVIELSVLSSRCSRRVSDRPTASRLARIQAKNHEFVVNLRHQAIFLNEFDRRCLAMLDGTRMVTGLERELGDTTNESLARLAANGLLTVSS